jgi:hypothetical protein
MMQLTINDALAVVVKPAFAAMFARIESAVTRTVTQPQPD